MSNDPHDPVLGARSDHAPTTAQANAPTRGVIFGQVLWRSLVLAVGGGAVIGFAVGLVLAVWALVWEDASIRELPVVLVLGTYVGAGTGIALGVLGGLLISTVAALRLVPYPGEGQTLLTMRVTSVVVVGLFMALLFGGAVGGWAGVALITALGLAGAWMSAPFLVGWYLQRLAVSPAD